MLRDRQQKGAVVRTEYSHLMTNKVVARSEVRGDLPRPGVVVRDHDVRRGPLAVRGDAKGGDDVIVTDAGD